jgi:hypothetical protein
MAFATEEKPVIFWADNYTEQEAKGGIFLRNPLKEGNYILIKPKQ